MLSELVEAPQSRHEGVPWHPQAQHERKRSRFRGAQEVSQDQAQVVRQRQHWITLRHFRQAASPGATTAAGFAEVGEGPFDHVPATTQQTFAAIASDAAMVRAIGRLLFGGFVGPGAAARRQRFGDVRSQAVRSKNSAVA